MNKKIWIFQLFIMMIFLTGLASHSGAEMQLTAPNGGETWYKGRTYNITWTDSRDRVIDIELKKGSNPSTIIARGISSISGRYSWLIPSDIEAGTDYRVKIIQPSNTANKDKSDNDFTIAEAAASEPPPPPPSSSSAPPRLQVPKKVIPMKQPGIEPKPKRPFIPSNNPSQEPTPAPAPAPAPGAGCDPNHVNQPDLTGAPRWASSSARFGSSITLSVPVDSETGYVNVVVHHTRKESGNWIAIAGVGIQSVTPGRTQTVPVSVRINPLPGTTALNGDYFPTITLCRSAGECTSNTGMQITYSGHGTTVTSGVNYNRAIFEGLREVSWTTSCYSIPILEVTE